MVVKHRAGIQTNLESRGGVDGSDSSCGYLDCLRIFKLALGFFKIPQNKRSNSLELPAKGGCSMSRVKVILGVLAIVATAFAAFPGSAMADTVVCSDSECDNTNIGQADQSVVTSGEASSTITVNSG